MWPISAYRDFKKKRAHDAQVRERDKIVARLYQAIDAGKPEWRGSPICDLCRHAKDPAMPGIAAKYIDRLEAKEGLKSALHDAIYLMNCMDSKDVQSAVAEKTFALAAKVDRKNEKLMATVAMASHLIAFNADEGTDQRTRGIALWKDTVDTLTRTSCGMDFAFAAASNAALGGKNFVTGPFPHPLRAEAIDIWYKTVTGLAKTDPVAATEEAKRIAENYNDEKLWGDVAPPFTAKAKEALNKMAFGN